MAAATAIGGFTVSPDGTTAAYVANVKGKTALWIHPLDGAPRMLPGTEDAGFPFWSPDGKSIAFFAGGKLLRTTIAGGTPLILCDVGSPRGGAWSEDGRIVFGTFGNGILQVPESGGMSRALTTSEAASDEHMWPQVVPGAAYCTGILVEIWSAVLTQLLWLSQLKECGRSPRIPTPSLHRW